MPSPTPTDPARLRRDLRRRMRRQRRQLTPDQRHAAGLALATHLFRHPVFRRARSIACFLSADGELDTRPVIEGAVRRGKRIYLPVLHRYAINRLWFAPYRPGDPLRLNRFNIPEPLSLDRRRPPMALDLVLTPLVAFDDAGNRLGMGGGYYDRTFAFLRHRRAWQRPRVLGLAYEFQRVEQLPSMPWDVPLWGVATERCVYRMTPEPDPE